MLAGQKEGGWGKKPKEKKVRGKRGETEGREKRLCLAMNKMGSAILDDSSSSASE